jgi:hypothetical protein
MPKPNLASMSIDELLRLREDIGKVLSHRANELKNQLSKLGGEIRSGRSNSLKGRKVPPSIAVHRARLGPGAGPDQLGLLWR